MKLKRQTKLFGRDAADRREPARLRRHTPRTPGRGFSNRPLQVPVRSILAKKGKKT